MWWLWKREEGRDAPSENGCCAVTEETCHLLVPGRDPSAAGGGRQVGEAAGRSGSDEIKAGLGSSLMPISRHVLSTSRLDAPGSREGAAQAGGLSPSTGAGSLRGPRASPGTLSILLSPSWWLPGAQPHPRGAVGLPPCPSSTKTSHPSPELHELGRRWLKRGGIAASRQLPTQHHGAAFEGSRPFPPQVAGLTTSRAFDICTHEGLGKKRRGLAAGQHPAAQGKARVSGCCRERFANFFFFLLRVVITTASAASLDL